VVLPVKEKTFVVRIDEETLSNFNSILKNKSINRSELFRQWIREYIEKEGEREDGVK